MTSSSRRMSGCIASARTIATRCCCPPESRSGYSSALSSSPKRLSSSSARAVGLVDRSSRAPSRCKGHVACSTVICGKRLNDWNTMPILLRTAFWSTPRAVMSSALDQDPASVDRLQQVDAAQQRRLARAARSDQTHDLVIVDGEIDPTQHLERRRTTCGAPRPAASARSRDATRLPPTLIALDQPIHEPRLRAP